MATTMARNRDDVDNMEVRDRLWDSMNYSYGQKREASDRAFAQAYSQAERSALKRGMQRSSYGQQTLANLDKQKVDAQNEIYDAQIADYESRLYQIEQDEQAQQQWQAQFDLQKQQADQARLQWEQNFAFQQAQADLAAEQWQKQFDESVRQFNEQMAKKGSGGGSRNTNNNNNNVPQPDPGYGNQTPGSASWFDLLNGFNTASTTKISGAGINLTNAKAAQVTGVDPVKKASTSVSKTNSAKTTKQVK